MTLSLTKYINLELEIKILFVGHLRPQDARKHTVLGIYEEKLSAAYLTLGMRLRWKNWIPLSTEFMKVRIT